MNKAIFHCLQTWSDLTGTAGHATLWSTVWCRPPASRPNASLWRPGAQLAGVLQPLSPSPASPHHMMPNHCSELLARPATFNTGAVCSIPLQPKSHYRSKQLSTHTALYLTQKRWTSLGGRYIAYFHLGAAQHQLAWHTGEPSGHISSPKNPAWLPICQNSKITLGWIKRLFRNTLLLNEDTLSKNKSHMKPFGRDPTISKLIKNTRKKF